MTEQFNDFWFLQKSTLDVTKTCECSDIANEFEGYSSSTANSREEYGSITKDSIWNNSENSKTFGYEVKATANVCVPLQPKEHRAIHNYVKACIIDTFCSV